MNEVLIKLSGGRRARIRVSRRVLSRLGLSAYLEPL